MFRLTRFVCSPKFRAPKNVTISCSRLMSDTANSNLSEKPVAEASNLFESVYQDMAEKETKLKKQAVSIPKTGAELPRFTTGNMRTSTKKLNLLARLIQGLSLEEAQRQMAMTMKRRGVRVNYLITRVISALKHNYNLDHKNFFIRRAWVGKGTAFKRVRFHARGRFGIMTKPVAHLKIELGNLKKFETKEEIDLDKLARQFRKHKLFLPLRETTPLRPIYQCWSKHSWKYVTSSKWVDPANAYKK